jgi:hypothetical protein
MGWPPRTARRRRSHRDQPAPRSQTRTVVPGRNHGPAGLAPGAASGSWSRWALRAAPPAPPGRHQPTAGPLPSADPGPVTRGHQPRRPRQGRGEGGGRGVRAGKPDDLMARADELGHDGGADPARRAGNENTHEKHPDARPSPHRDNRCQLLSSADEPSGSLPMPGARVRQPQVQGLLSPAPLSCP